MIRKDADPSVQRSTNVGSQNFTENTSQKAEVDTRIDAFKVVGMVSGKALWHLSTLSPASNERIRPVPYPTRIVLAAWKALQFTPSLAVLSLSRRRRGTKGM